MKKVFFLVALMCASVAMMAETELVDWSKMAVETWGGSTYPEAAIDAANQKVTIEIKATPGWQWGNQVKLTLSNVATAGLDVNKEYQLSFTAVASTTDCGGVTLKYFDNNQLSYSGDNCTEANRAHSEGCLALNTTPLNYQSEWIQPEAAATNATIVWDFGWDPAQTVTITNLSFKERTAATAIENAKVGVGAVKTVENGQLVIIKNGVKYNVAGQEVK